MFYTESDGLQTQTCTPEKKNPSFDIQNKPRQLLELPAQNIYTFIRICRFPVTKKKNSL